MNPISLELLHAGLVTAAQEMAGVLKHSSFSPIIREMEDFSCALFDAAGNLVAQADNLPAQLGAMSIAVQSTIKMWAPSIRPGDVYIANHPYMGCMHTPDLNVLKPVFVDGRILAWAGCTAHHIDVGGVNPGTEGASLGEVFAEGLLLPPTRLYVAGLENPDVFQIIHANVRDPEWTAADLRAQRAACLIGERRIEEMVRRHGMDMTKAALREVLDSVEHETRVALASLPDGAGEAEGFLDDDGVGGPPTRIHVKLTKVGDHLTIDLSGTSHQVAGALNVPWASTRAGIVYLVRAITDPTMTTNDGVLRAVDIICPEGSILNPLPPRAVSVRHNTCQRLADTMVRAAGHIWPQVAVASSTVTFFDINLDSYSPRNGRSSVMMDVVGGGTGGWNQGDGLDGVDTYMSNVALLPVEVAETEYSVRILKTELVPGSQGLGQFNGGLGLRREYEILGRSQTATIYAEQTNPAFRPLGVLGGTDGAATRLTILDPHGKRLQLPSKTTTRLEPGSIVRIETSGGGGYGHRARRESSLRRADQEDDRLGSRSLRQTSGPTYQS